MKHNISVVCFLILFGMLRVVGQEVHSSFFRVLTLGAPKSELYFSQVPPPAPNPDNPKESLPSPDYTETLVPVSLSSRSLFLPYKQTDPLYFVIHEGNIYKTVGYIKSLDNLSLLLIQPTGNAERINITVLRDDPASFPGGAFEVVNLSSLDVQLNLASQATSVKRTENKVVLPPVNEGDRFSVELFRSSDLHRQYSSVAKYKKHIRFLMFIIDVDGVPNNIQFEKLIDSPDSAVTPTQGV